MYPNRGGRTIHIQEKPHSKLYQGIGLAAAHYLLSQSHKLVLVSRTTTALTQLRDQYGADQVEVVAGDLSDFSISKEAVQIANDRFGRLDGLIVNHGSLDPVKKVSDSSPEEWSKAFDTNVFSAIALVSIAGQWGEITCNG